MNRIYHNIKDREVPALLRSAYEESGKDIEAASLILDRIDTMIGVLQMKSLINARERSARTRWTRGRGLTAVLAEIIKTS